VNNTGSNRRILIIAGLLGIFALTIVIHYGRIMLSPAPVGNDPTPGLPVERGPILDRNGRLLAIQTELPTVTAWTPYIDDPEGTADQLSRILDLEYDNILSSLQLENRDVIIKRTISPGEAEVIELLQQQGELRGVTLRRDFGRIYPEGRTASHVLGFTGTENVGLEGIELTQNAILSPQNGTAGSREYGNQIFLTLDVVIQHSLEEIAERLMDEHDPDSVMILVMDAPSGEFLGYVSVPDFDPNTFSEFEDDDRYNRPIRMAYEPGSVFKVFSLASIIHLGGVNDDSRFDTRGGYVSDQIDIPITDLGNYGIIDPGGIIRLSSNVGAAYASDTVDRESFYYMLRQFGFGQSTGLELNGEQRGLLAPEPRWSGRTKPTIAIGQEIGVTAVQMMQAATVLANDGIMLKPHLIKRIVDPSGTIIREYQREPVREVLRRPVADQILNYMNGASQPNGTGRRAAVEGINISVKTGTAEVIDPETGRYSDELFIASTLAIFPTEDPQVIVYVVIQHPRGESFLGGVIAAPVVREIAEFLIPYLQIVSGGQRIVDLPPNLEIFEPVLPEIGTEIPDFRGLPMRTVIPLYAREDIFVQIYGSGWVVNQDPAPGSPYSEGMELKLYLEDSDSPQDEIP
jgi:cell division protein FtsI (penicillin-binding protein 3)